MTTLRQAEANRRNAEKSTGPRTESGKEASRRNALKHGNAGVGVVLAEDVEEAVRVRYEEWAKDFGPATPYQRFLVEQIAVNSVRLEQCAKQEIYERGQLSHRAAFCWDDDRNLAAEQLGQALAKRPGLVAKQLERTPQGCEWLLGRWDSLARMLARNGGWSAAERSLALDLLGTPTELREDTSPLLGDPDAIVRTEVERLDERKERLRFLDDRDRELTASGRSVEPDARLANTRRYEARIARAMRWAMGQYFRVTLGVGLSCPSLGFPVPAEPSSEAEAGGPWPVAGAEEVNEPEARIEPEPAPGPGPEPVSEPVARNVAVAPTPLPIPHPVPPVVEPSAPKRTRGNCDLEPSPVRNRQQRRAEKARARRAS
jgi:hypothetical protein